MIEAIIADILAENSIEKINISHIKSNGNEHMFFINDKYVLRLTDRNTDNQIRKLKQIESLDSIQRIRFHKKSFSNTIYNYIIYDKLEGIDYIDAISTMSKSQNSNLGTSIATFLDSLHTISSTHYDIGHYIPIIPNHEGSWRNGHVKYWEYMKNSLDTIQINLENKSIFSNAFEYLFSNSEVLKFEQGPVLLHNDLHPKNIIVDNGNFSGVIDWECSQFGEPDFELCHFIHWCVYPPAPNVDLNPFLFSLLNKAPKCTRVQNLHERLTIYQIEHEIMQIIWSKGKAQGERIPKIKNWMNGQVEKMLQVVDKCAE